VLKRDAVGEAVPRLRRQHGRDPLIAIGVTERESRDAVARPAFGRLFWLAEANQPLAGLYSLGSARKSRSPVQS
jgi:hypothetical protein